MKIVTNISAVELALALAAQNQNTVESTVEYAPSAAIPEEVKLMDRDPFVEMEDDRCGWEYEEYTPERFGFKPTRR